MIKSTEKLKKDCQGAIMCPKHNILASGICLEEKCSYQINCMNCSILDNHKHHIRNICINNVLNVNIDNQIFDESISMKKIK